MARVHPEIYFFGAGVAEGRAAMRDLLGGKGANLAEMASLKLPVPPGFTISTQVCNYFYDHKQQISEGARPRASRKASRGSKKRSAASSATRRIRCWSRCARARGSRCRG